LVLQDAVDDARLSRLTQMRASSLVRAQMHAPLASQVLPVR
jgi:hypothetical protein